MKHFLPRRVSKRPLSLGPSRPARPKRASVKGFDANLRLERRSSRRA